MMPPSSCLYDTGNQSIECHVNTKEEGPMCIIPDHAQETGIMPISEWELTNSLDSTASEL